MHRPPGLDCVEVKGVSQSMSYTHVSNQISSQLNHVREFHVSVSESVL